MSPQDQEHLRNLTFADIQDENGIDVTQIDELLAMSPAQRLRRLQECQVMLDWLDQVREQNNAKFARTAGRAARDKG